MHETIKEKKHSVYKVSPKMHETYVTIYFYAILYIFNDFLFYYWLNKIVLLDRIYRTFWDSSLYYVFSFSLWKIFKSHKGLKIQIFLFFILLLVNIEARLVSFILVKNQFIVCLKSCVLFNKEMCCTCDILIRLKYIPCIPRVYWVRRVGKEPLAPEPVSSLV